jgi:hypothetical protein
MDVVALDEGAGAGGSKTNANARKLRSRRHFGNASSHFSQATTAAKESRLRNRVTANSNISHSNRYNANRGRSASLSRSK